MDSQNLPLVDVDRLQVGVFVVLDLGWRNHPFAFNSFTIRNDEQLRQLRSLGVAQVRYCPQRSAVQPLSAVGLPQAAASAPAPPAAQSPIHGVMAEPVTPLQRQRASLARVEAAFEQVTHSHQRLLRLVKESPLQACQLAEQIGTALHQQLAEQGEIAIRLLSSKVGDSPSAHEISVAALSMLLARDCGFSDDDGRELALAALLHDVGKQNLAPFLRWDEGRLSDAERRTYRTHVRIGVDFARAMGLSANVVRAIAEHHEHCDGSGFPAALRGEQLSPAGRVLAIVNRYQDLICPQHFAAGMTPHAALRQMYGVERAHYDPVYLPRFVRIMGIYPPGTMVELNDQRMAVVVASRPGMSLAPRVQILSSPDREEQGLAFDLDMQSGPRIQHSVRPELLPARWAQRARQLARTPVFFEPQSEQVASVAA